MKAGHPLFRPFFRFFVWQERLSRGWKIALTIGPLLVARALLRPASDHTPLLIGLIALWLLFVAGTWMSVPIANLALRLSPSTGFLLTAFAAGLLAFATRLTPETAPTARVSAMTLTRRAGP